MQKIHTNTTPWALTLILALSALPLAAQAAPTTGSYDASMAPPIHAAAPTPVTAQPAAPQSQPETIAAVESPEPPPPPQDQVKDELFAGTEKFAKGASDVSDVNIGPNMLGMVSGKHGGDLAHKMNFVIVHSYTYPHPGMYNLADVDAYRQKLHAGHWNCFVHTYEEKSGESTDVCNRALSKGEGYEMVVLTVEPKELTFVHISGRGSMADLSQLGNLGNLGALGTPKPPKPPTPPAPPAPPKQ